jgi:hypothetical protein
MGQKKGDGLIDLGLLRAQRKLGEQQAQEQLATLSMCIRVLMRQLGVDRIEVGEVDVREVLEEGRQFALYPHPAKPNVLVLEALDAPPTAEGGEDATEHA